MFLIRPPPFNSESLSSWRQRAATMNGLRRYPVAPGCTRHSDPDRIRSDFELAWLRSEFRLTEKELRSLTLDHALSLLGCASLEGDKLHWVLPHNGDALSVSGRPMFCPQCLEEDEVPYFRIAWRLACNARCEIHGCMLEERCPFCGSSVWPTTCHRRECLVWLPFDSCQSCGKSLAKSERRAPKRQAKAVTEYSEIQSADSDINALWYVSQLLIRRRSRLLRSKVFSFASIAEMESPASTTIEQVPVAQRAAILAAARWLLDEWPDRFIRLTKASSVSLQRFSGTLHLAPHWIQKEVRQHLVLRDRTKATRESIKRAVDEISESGNSVSKSEVRRRLQVTESAVLNRMMCQRRHATPEELREILRRIAIANTLAPQERHQRTAAQRDFLIFVLSILGKLKIEQVCNLSRSQVLILLQGQSKPREQQRKYIVKLAHRIFEEISQRQSRQQPSADVPFFLSRWGLPILGHCVRARISKLMQNGFPADLWRSSDVFLVLSPGEAAF
ncbi:hypothetical protein GTP41_20860 [Pseudoduganella sp. DS3]|uniref:TniQ domain-containing protein n=1 Tax=Pseudoduganella guangdongensis TaxID=2692179 RepID=A0A6N9HMN7_9BURK|nr:hypothetical protein [Pseudoduganella guangdongensis]